MKRVFRRVISADEEKGYDQAVSDVRWRTSKTLHAANQSVIPKLKRLE